MDKRLSPRAANVRNRSPEILLLPLAVIVLVLEGLVLHWAAEGAWLRLGSISPELREQTDGAVLCGWLVLAFFVWLHPSSLRAALRRVPLALGCLLAVAAWFANAALQGPGMEAAFRPQARAAEWLWVVPTVLSQLVVTLSLAFALDAPRASGASPGAGYGRCAAAGLAALLCWFAGDAFSALINLLIAQSLLYVGGALRRKRLAYVAGSLALIGVAVLASHEHVLGSPGNLPSWLRSHEASTSQADPVSVWASKQSGYVLALLMLQPVVIWRAAVVFRRACAGFDMYLAAGCGLLLALNWFSNVPIMLGAASALHGAPFALRLHATDYLVHCAALGLVLSVSRSGARDTARVVSTEDAARALPQQVQLSQSASAQDARVYAESSAEAGLDAPEIAGVSRADARPSDAAPALWLRAASLFAAVPAFLVPAGASPTRRKVVLQALSWGAFVTASCAAQAALPLHHFLLALPVLLHLTLEVAGSIGRGGL